ncbi:MAG: septum formation inhibitor Maf [Proteobacteria bacterium]|nr:septum formation inhibitor Maf [Pseudomonadota bacterium]
MIYLASNSPRRRELLKQIHVRFEPLLFRTGARADADVNEDALPGEDAFTYVQRVAMAKAVGGIKRIAWRSLPPRLLLAADTTLELDGAIIGKPDNAEHAVDILRSLSGRSHQVLTAVVVGDGQHFAQRLSVSEVRFRAVDEQEIRRYVASGEAADKAGAYGIQGRAALFIEEIRGSYTGIMGLPLFETAALLQEFGYPL